MGTWSYWHVGSLFPSYMVVTTAKEQTNELDGGDSTKWPFPSPLFGPTPTSTTLHPQWRVLTKRKKGNDQCDCPRDFSQS